MFYVALLLGCLGRALRPMAALLLVDLALRQQLAVYQRRATPAPRWGSVFLVAARPEVARLVFAAAVRPNKGDALVIAGVA